MVWYYIIWYGIVWCNTLTLCEGGSQVYDRVGEGRGKGVRKLAEEADRVEVASGVIVRSLRRFRAWNPKIIGTVD